METAFYVVGSALVVIALVISFIGMRSDSFPSTGVLRAGIAFVAVVVMVTAYFAVEASQHEEEEREREANIEAAELAEEEELANEDDEATGVESEGGEDAPGDRDETDGEPNGGTQLAGDPEAGAGVYVDQGCGGCHSLQDAGTSGQLGPNLDEALVDEDEAFIEMSIVDPGAEIEEGFSDGIMPTDYGDTIPPEELADLVAYLASVTSGASK